MNEPFHKPQQSRRRGGPSELATLLPLPLLLRGEDPEQYHFLRQAIFADLAPQSAIEWLLALDIAELSWEIRRYRVLRHKALETFRQKAIETALRHIDMVGIGPEFEREAELYTMQNALSWRVDPIATDEIEARLAAYGFDDDAVSMEVYVQAREVLTFFEGLLHSAQNKRLIILKEIKHHRAVNSPTKAGR